MKLKNSMYLFNEILKQNFIMYFEILFQIYYMFNEITFVHRNKNKDIFIESMHLEKF